MKRRGADRVVGVDVDERYLNQARLAAALSGVEIELRQMSVYQVAQLAERFDVVLFMGVLYHLRHPLVAYFIEQHHAGDPTNWWIPNASALAAMLRSAGFKILERPEEEVFICAVDQT